jgi:hypothetical protein
MFTATHKIISNDGTHAFDVGTEVVYTGDSEFDGCGVYMNRFGLTQEVMMLAVEELRVNHNPEEQVDNTEYPQQGE